MGYINHLRHFLLFCSEILSQKQSLILPLLSLSTQSYNNPIFFLLSLTHSKPSLPYITPSNHHHHFQISHNHSSTASHHLVLVLLLFFLFVFAVALSSPSPLRVGRLCQLTVAHHLPSEVNTVFCILLYSCMSSSLFLHVSDLLGFGVFRSDLLRFAHIWFGLYCCLDLSVQRCSTSLVDSPFIFVFPFLLPLNIHSSSTLSFGKTGVLLMKRLWKTSALGGRLDGRGKDEESGKRMGVGFLLVS